MSADAHPKMGYFCDVRPRLRQDLNGSVASAFFWADLLIGDESGAALPIGTKMSLMD